MNDVLIEKIKSLIRYAMIFAQRSHDYIFNSSIDNFIAIAYLNIASAKFSTAEAIYYSHLEELQRREAETIFHLFDVYANELLNNISTDHSHQWTDIEFNRLKECFDASVFAPESE